MNISYEVIICVRCVSMYERFFETPVEHDFDSGGFKCEKAQGANEDKTK